MTERGRGDVVRDARRLAIGPSALHWDGTRLVIEIDERGTPLPKRVRGRVVVEPRALTGVDVALDAEGRHRWTPYAPCARVWVELSQPALRWRGAAYVDGNHGDAPIDEAFRRWDWLRAARPDGSTVVVYDPTPVDGAAGRLTAARFAPDGTIDRLEPAARRPLPPSRWWRIPRAVRADGDAAADAAVVRTLEDTPFYARSLVELTVGGRRGLAVHESLEATRLRSPLVQRLLPFRMPRRA